MKTFTLDEANALIPQINVLLDEMLQVRKEIVAVGAELGSILRHAGGNGGSKNGGDYVLLLQRFNASLTALQELGCELKDLGQGLVDFPSYREGQLVYLCWKRGEEQIQYWHGLEAGFAGRQPL
jgi:hypothetical protein